MTPDLLDANGWPTSLPASSGGVYTVFFIPTQTERPGNYVVTWQGNGSISLLAGKVVRGSQTSTSGSGTFTFAPAGSGATSGRIGLGIERVGTPHITELRCCHENDFEALTTGQIFASKFLQTLRQGNPGVIRFMGGWQVNNGCNVTTWSTRKPINYAFYAGYSLDPTRYAGVTTNRGNAYSASLSGFTLADKAMVHIVFNESATRNGTCISMLMGLATSTYCFKTVVLYLWAAIHTQLVAHTKAFGTLVYDATLNAWIMQGGNVATGSSGIQNGAPYELMFELCKLVGAHPWFNTPQFAVDPLSDFLPNLIDYHKTKSRHGWSFFKSFATRFGIRPLVSTKLDMLWLKQLPTTHSIRHIGW